MTPDKGMARVLACLMGLFAWMAWGQAAADSKRQDVYWSGFAFTGEASSREDAVPYMDAAVTGRGAEALNMQMLAALHRRPPSHIAVIDGAGLAQLGGTTSATVLAAAIDRETVSIEPIGGQYKILVELALQALLFDFREQQVIASYPMTLQYTDLMSHQPSHADLRSIVEDLVYGSADNQLASILAKTLSDVRLPDAAVRRIQVGGVALSDTARQKLPNGASESLLKATLSHELSKIISSNAGIGLLPPSVGEAIGGTMAARFSDGRVFQLTIPEADYVIRVHIDDWRRGVLKRTPAMRQELFGAFFNIEVLEPHSGTVYFNQPLRKGATKIIPATQEEVDAWSASYETLLAGFDAFAKAASAQPGHRDWLGEQKPGGRSLQQHTKALQELIQSCR